MYEQGLMETEEMQECITKETRLTMQGGTTRSGLLPFILQRTYLR
jgi:hypothetical protein